MLSYYYSTQVEKHRSLQASMYTLSRIMLRMLAISRMGSGGAEGFSVSSFILSSEVHNK